MLSVAELAASAQRMADHHRRAHRAAEARALEALARPAEEPPPTKEEG